MELRVTDRLNPERTEKDLRGIFALVVEVRREFEEAVEVGVYGSRGEQLTLGRGFSDSDPTAQAAGSPTKRQARQAARRAAELISEAKATLQEASNVLHSGMLRMDPEVHAEFLEKRAAAIQR